MSKPRYHWISPYTMAEKLCFWREIDYDEPWVKTFNKVMTPISVAIQKVLNFVHPEINYVKIDYYDTWSMDATLSPIILPMLKQLRDTKHGYPWTYHEDGPWYYRFQLNTEGLSENNEGSYNSERWNWIMDEMIWTFEQLSKDDYDSRYWLVKGEIDWDNRVPEEKGLIELKWKKESVVDWDGLKKHEEAIQNGLRLFGKYYKNLWD